MRYLFTSITSVIGGTLNYIGQCMSAVFNDPYAGILFIAALLLGITSLFIYFKIKRNKEKYDEKKHKKEVKKQESELRAKLSQIFDKFIEEFIYLVSSAVMMIFKIIEVIQSYVMLFIDYFSGRLHNRTIAKIMILSILALSVTSFFTTYSGMQSLVESSNIRLLLVFGIQAILFASSIKIGENLTEKIAYPEKTINKFMERIYITVFAVTLTISSFFSYNYFLDTLYTDEARYVDNFEKIKNVSYEILIDVDSKVPKYKNNLEIKQSMSDYFDKLIATIGSDDFGKEIFDMYSFKSEYDSISALISDIDTAKSKDEIVKELEGLLINYEESIFENNSLINNLNSKITSNEIAAQGQSNAALSNQIASLQQDIANKRGEITKVQNRITEVKDSQNIEQNIDEAKTSFKEKSGYSFEEYGSLLVNSENKKAKLDKKSEYISKIISLSNNINSDEYGKAENDANILDIKQYLTEFNNESIKDIVREYTIIESYYSTLKQYDSYIKVKDENINQLDKINLEFNNTKVVDSTKNIANIDNTADQAVNLEMVQSIQTNDAEQIYKDQVSKLLSIVTETVIKAPIGEEYQALTDYQPQSEGDLSYKHKQLSKIRNVVRNTDSRLHDIEKNYRALGQNFLLAITSLLLAVIIDCAILFTGFLIPKSSSVVKFTTGSKGYNTEETENMLRSMFTRPVFKKKKENEENNDEEDSREEDEKDNNDLTQADMIKEAYDSIADKSYSEINEIAEIEQEQEDEGRD